MPFLPGSVLAAGDTEVTKVEAAPALMEFMVQAELARKGQRPPMCGQRG